MNATEAADSQRKAVIIVTNCISIEIEWRPLVPALTHMYLLGWFNAQNVQEKSMSHLSVVCFFML